MQPDCLKGRVVLWKCLHVWGQALKSSPGINHKSRVSYSGPGFLCSATWPLNFLPKKHCNGLNQTKPNCRYEQSLPVCISSGVMGLSKDLPVLGQRVLTAMPSSRNSSAMPRAHIDIPYFAIVYAVTRKNREID